MGAMEFFLIAFSTFLGATVALAAERLTRAHDARLREDARAALTPRSRALPHLQQMTRACNTFLERSEREDEQRLKDALRGLAVEMSGEVQALHHLQPRRILDDRPGSLAI
jgi:hypothetical protein